MDIRAALAGRLYADAPAPARSGPIETLKDRPDFGRALQQSAIETLRAVREAEGVVTAGMTGGADAQSVVEALAATELAVETATTVRDRVVEAYNEILRMPV